MQTLLIKNSFRLGFTIKWRDRNKIYTIITFNFTFKKLDIMSYKIKTKLYSYQNILVRWAVTYLEDFGGRH